MEKTKNRIIYFDYLRIISIFAVVVLHAAAQNWSKLDVFSPDWTVLSFYDSLVRWAVPVFVMMSGALFLGREQKLKKLYKNNILRILVVLIIWSTLYAIWQCCFVKPEFKATSFVREIMVGHYHLWFLYMLIGIYIVIPFFNKIIEDRNLAIYFIVLAIIFAFIVPQGIAVLKLQHKTLPKILDTVMDKLRINLVMEYYGYFILGYILNKARFSKTKEALIYVGGLFGAAATFFGTVFMSRHTHTASKVFFNNITINVLLMAIAVFVFAKQHLNKMPKNEKGLKFVLFLSKCTFGIYLIHPLLIEILLKYFNITNTTYNPIIFVPVFSLGLFAVSMLVSMLLNCIPKISKWIV